MAHLWIHSSGGWAAATLGAARLELARGADGQLELRGSAASCGAGCWLRRVDGELETWVLLASPGAGAVVNGEPVRTGVRVLADRDEIRLRGLVSVYYSTETLARPVRFPGTSKATRCARCQKPIEPGQLAVQCPNCGIWHHEYEGRPCWTYRETCTQCPQGTSLDASYRWTPDEEEEDGQEP